VSGDGSGALPGGGAAPHWMLRRLSRCLWDRGEPAGEGTALVFPYAGGSVYSMHDFCAALPRYRTVLVQYPGRGPRSRDELATSIPELAESALAEYAEHVDDPAPLLVGHSVGALVAYEAARQLDIRGSRARALVVSSASPPHFRPSAFRESAARLVDLDDRMFVTELSARGGIPLELTGEQELLTLAVPAIRNDLRIGLDYLTREQFAVLDCPIVAAGGADDCSVPPDVLDRWADLTMRTFTTGRWPGGHFYYRNHVRGLAELFAGLAPARRLENATTESDPVS
jgi:surfactin synthase thioesterase subunit